MKYSQKRLPIAVLISGNGSNLQAIIDAINAGLPAIIKIVISNNENAYGLVRAKQANIPIAVIQSTRNREQDERQLIKILDQHQPELILLAGYMRILSSRFIQHYPNRILNIHPSLLPKYRGLETHQKALANQDLEHGCTIHLVTQDLDAGPIIAYSRLSVLADDDAHSLQQRVHQLEHRLYPKVIELFARNRLKLIDHQLYLDDRLIPPTGIEL